MDTDRMKKCREKKCFWIFEAEQTHCHIMKILTNHFSILPVNLIIYAYNSDVFSRPVYVCDALIRSFSGKCCIRNYTCRASQPSLLRFRGWFSLRLSPNLDIDSMEEHFLHLRCLLSNANKLRVVATLLIIDSAFHSLRLSLSLLLFCFWGIRLHGMRWELFCVPGYLL